MPISNHAATKLAAEILEPIGKLFDFNVSELVPLAGRMIENGVKMHELQEEIGYHQFINHTLGGKRDEPNGPGNPTS